MTDRTPEQNLQAYADVVAAADRLAAQGLAKSDPRGVNNDGLQTLADLLSLLMVQTGNGDSKAERVAGASARAMLSALGDLYAELSGETPDGAHTQRMLAAATKAARS